MSPNNFSRQRETRDTVTYITMCKTGAREFKTNIRQLCYKTKV